MKKKIRSLSDEELKALFDKEEADAKKEHCAECKKAKKRFDARNLGYCIGWLYGDADTSECDGCYWHDTYYFRATASAGYKPKHEL